jgi:hypothetical protein
MTEHQRRHQTFGLALALALILIPIILVLAFALTQMGTQNLNHADAARHGKKALLAAETGAIEAIRHLHADPSWSAGWSTPQTLLNGPETYTVEVTNNVSGSSTKTASNGAIVPPGTTYILATGFSRGNDFQRRVGVLLRAGSADLTFRYGIFCHESIDIGNGDIDSFDSDDAPYNQTPPQDLKDGPIGTNSVNSPPAGGVQIGPQGSVGDIDIGVGGDNDVAVSCHGGSGGHNNCPTHGAVSSLDDPYPLNLSLVTPPAGVSQGDVNCRKDETLAPGHYDKVGVNGRAVVTLSAGVYVMKSLDVGGSGQLVIGSGPVKIYITGDPKTTADLNLGGNSVSNTTGLASNLQFLVGPDVEEVVINGGPKVECTVMAPKSAVTINGTAGSFTGAVVARTARFTGNVVFHYDRALASSGGTGTQPVSIISWQRI